ncbi:MAG: tRNA epoxyqueuosine(34) reductase QueG, partial [Pyrinomonadaceae bacterium]
MTLSNRIRQKAAAIGIDKVGIVAAEPLAEEGARLSEWLDLGFQGQMSWLEREPEKRSDPRRLMPEARSVIVAPGNNITPHQHDNDHCRGKKSRYASGYEYNYDDREKQNAQLECKSHQIPTASG